MTTNRILASAPALLLLAALTACSGGGATVGPGGPPAVAPVAPIASGGGGGGGGASGGASGASPTPKPSGSAAGTTPGATASPTTTAPVGGSTPTATPAGGPTPTAAPAGGPTPTATPTGSASGAQSLFAAPTAPPDDPNHTNSVPAVPTSGCRAGQTYNVYVDSGPTNIAPSGSLEAFTVFEPSQICAGHNYPLIFNGPGFGASRTSAVGSFSSFTSAGYGVISVDEAGEGEDGGKIRVMDPDQEGVMLLAVMNWAQAKLPWLAYGPTNDGVDQREPIFGAEGGSYGGMYQFMLLNVDKRHRLRAIVPQITPANLNFSLFQGGAVKTLWDAELFSLGQAAGNGTKRAQFDPYVNNGFANDFATNSEDAGFHDFFAYHSVDYFCNGASVGSNGGAGTMPNLPPATTPPKINALIWIGVRDTLFDFNNGYANYACMQRGGGDVRLLSYQTGHNALGTVPDPYVSIFYPVGDQLDAKCGRIDEAMAEFAWFEQYLKGKNGAASFIPMQPCISLSAGDGVTVPAVPTYRSGPGLTAYPVSATVVAGVTPDAAGNAPSPNVVPLSIAGPSGDVEAGIPHVVLDVAPVGGVTANQPTVYVGLGVLHAGNGNVYDLVDNQVSPLVGTGHFDVDLVGGGIRMLPGDRLALLIFGFSNQYAATGTVHAAMPVPQAVTVTGKVYVPDLGPTPANI